MNLLPPDFAELAQLRVVLSGTSAPGNVGAVARAMKVMGLRDLCLVAPRYSGMCRKAEAIAFSSGALDVLNNAIEVDTLDEALGSRSQILALTRRPRDFAPPSYTAREWAQNCAADRTYKHTVLLFGNERNGLSNEEVLRATGIIEINSDASYGSLNLAQAVQIVCYEARMAMLSLSTKMDVAATSTAHAIENTGWAKRVEVEGLFQHLESALTHLGYHNPAEPKTLMQRLRSQFARSQLTTEEINIWRGIAKEILRAPKTTDR